MFKGDGGIRRDTLASSDNFGMAFDENKNAVTRKERSSPRFTAVCDSFHHEEVRFFDGAWSVRSTSMKRARSGPDVRIGQGNKIWVVFFPPTASPLMAGVKGKDVLFENRSGGGVEMS